MNVRRHLDANEVTRAVTLLQEGRSQRFVGQVLNVSQSVVSRLWRRHQETELVTRRPGQGRHRATTAIDDRFIRLQALRNRTSTARSLQNNLSAARGVQISDQTVRNRLREVNLRFRRPVKKPKLTRNHRRARLLFAREHQRWQVRNWSQVMFSDESRFKLWVNDGRVRVLRRPNERYLPSTIHETVAFGDGSVMIWGGIWIDGRTDLVIINGPLTARRYIDEVLDVHVRPQVHEMDGNFILMHDNARPHTARIVTEYLEQHDINTMRWPAVSPDMNPIEHLWDQLGRAIRKRLNPPNTLQELQQALIEEWQRIPQINIRRLIRSMPRRCQALVRAGGGATRY